MNNLFIKILTNGNYSYYYSKYGTYINIHFGHILYFKMKKNRFQFEYLQHAYKK